MKAFRMLELGSAQMTDAPVPELQPGEALIEPVLTGICSTDIHVLHQGAVGARVPVTLGHEVVGRVVDIRSGETLRQPYPGGEAIQPGSLVTVEPLLPCGACPQCYRGLPNLCGRSTHLGITRDGCFAEFLTVPDSRVFAVNDLDPARAIFVEPLACALHFLHQGGVEPGMNVLVAGAGPAGLLTLQAASAAGARVFVSEPDAARRALALRLGAEAAFDPCSEDVPACIQELTRGSQAEVIIEITGVPGAISELLSWAAPGSTIVLAGICGGRRVELDSDRVVTGEVTIRGAVASRWQFQRAAQLLKDGRIDTTSLISHRRPWSEVPDLIDVAAGVEGVTKVLLDHSSV